MAKQVSITITIPGAEQPLTLNSELSPYSYQHFPKTPSALKATVLGAADQRISLTKGRGRHYLYFRKDSRVEWCAITAEAHKAIGAGAATAITEVAPSAADAAEQGQPTADTKPKAGKAGKRATADA